LRSQQVRPGLSKFGRDQIAAENTCAEPGEGLGDAPSETVAGAAHDNCLAVESDLHYAPRQNLNAQPPD
jgi:hypothetical protein